MFRTGNLLTEAAEDSAAALAKLASDIRALLTAARARREGDEGAEDEVPESIKSLLRVLQTREAAAAAENLARGALQGALGPAPGGGEAADPGGGLADALEAALSVASTPRARSLLTLVVSRAARESSAALVDAAARHLALAQLGAGAAPAGPAGGLVGAVEGAAASPAVRDLLLEALSTVVTAAVSGYVETSATLHLNVADSVISSVMKAQHQEAVQGLFGRVSREVVETLLSSPATAERGAAGTPPGPRAAPASPPPANHRRRGPGGPGGARGPATARSLHFPPDKDGGGGASPPATPAGPPAAWAGPPAGWGGPSAASPAPLPLSRGT